MSIFDDIAEKHGRRNMFQFSDGQCLGQLCFKVNLPGDFGSNVTVPSRGIDENIEKSFRSHPRFDTTISYPRNFGFTRVPSKHFAI